MKETKDLLRFLYGIAIGIALKKPFVWFLSLAKNLWDAVIGISKVDDELLSATDKDFEDLGADAESYFASQGLSLGAKAKVIAVQGASAAKHLWNVVRILARQNA